MWRGRGRIRRGGVGLLTNGQHAPRRVDIYCWTRYEKASSQVPSDAFNALIYFDVSVSEVHSTAVVKTRPGDCFLFLRKHFFININEKYTGINNFCSSKRHLINIWKGQQAERSSNKYSTYLSIKLLVGVSYRSCKSQKFSLEVGVCVLRIDFDRALEADDRLLLLKDVLENASLVGATYIYQQ